MKKSVLALWRAAALAAVCALPPGCDNNSEVVSEDDGGGETGFAIVPSAVNLAAGESRATFTVQGGDAPMAWAVSDSSLGQITNSDGRFVNYARAGATEGLNEVSVTDAVGRTARAVIVQDNRGTDGPLQISPAGAILHTVDQTVTLTARGGVPPYHWTLIDNNIATLSNTGQSAVNYRRTSQAPGTNVVELRDAQNTLATATLVHR